MTKGAWQPTVHKVAESDTLSTAQHRVNQDNKEEGLGEAIGVK